MAETIKIFLSELNPAEGPSHPSGASSFWAMPKPVSKEVSAITQAAVESEVLEVFQVECAGINIEDVVHAWVYDKNDNKIFGGYISRDEKVTLYPITEIFQD